MNQRRSASRCAELFDILDEVKDPEIPVLSIWDLGILQDVDLENETVRVVITPTYSGCPAMQQITQDIEAALREAGFTSVEIKQQLIPAWTTDWLDADARKRLREFGIAGPGKTACPQCGSTDVTQISEFGSTSCKSLMRCNACQEPFDQFKRF